MVKWCEQVNENEAREGQADGEKEERDSAGRRSSSQYCFLYTASVCNITQTQAG